MGAAGGGREILALENAGFEVDGFECDETLVASAQRRLEASGSRARIFAARPGEVPPIDRTYDGGIVGWGAMTHIVGQDRRVEFLRAFGRALNPQAPLLISYFVRDEDSRGTEWVFQIASAVRWLRRAQPVARGDTLDQTFDHFFVRRETENEFEAAGFELVHYDADRPPHGHAVGRRKRGKESATTVGLVKAPMTIDN